MISSETWQEIKGIVDKALDLPPGDHRAFVERACGTNERLRQEVESLLTEESLAGEFLARPLVTLSEEGGTDPDEGRCLGAWRLLHRLGAGGMGVVYLAESIADAGRHRVAVKLVKRGMDSEETLRRFQVERRILTCLTHPYIVRLLDAGMAEAGRPYFVMEHIEGRPLDRYCAEHRLCIRRRLELFRRVCSGVDFAHQNRVVHRDLKPANILVTATGVPKLLDFGIAKLLGSNPGHSGSSTSPSTRPMTPRFASPEQICGGTVTAAVDIYALGVILYELLTGCRPHRFADESTREVARVVCATRPLKPSKAVRRTMVHARSKTADSMPFARGGCSGPRGDRRLLARRLAGDLDILVLKALHKRPEHRFFSVDELSEELRRHLEGLPILSRPERLFRRTADLIHRVVTVLRIKRYSLEM